MIQTLELVEKDLIRIGMVLRKAKNGEVYVKFQQ